MTTTYNPTPTVHIDRTVSSSEAAALHGHKAKTPMISGIVSGGAVALMWFVAGVIYLQKRRRNARIAHAAGLHRRQIPPKVLPHKDAQFIIPPDPAIIQGQRKPGDCAFPDDPNVPDEEKAGASGSGVNLMREANGYGLVQSPLAIGGAPNGKKRAVDEVILEDVTSGKTPAGGPVSPTSPTHGSYFNLHRSKDPSRNPSRTNTRGSGTGTPAAGTPVAR